MTPLLWMMVAACFVPYVPYLAMIVAKRMSPGGYDPHDPRGQNAKLEGYGKRAFAVHQNAFEAVPSFLFAAGLVVHLGAEGTAATALAALWHACRLAYLGLYLADQPTARSSAWTVAVLATLGLMAVAVLH